MAMKKVDVWFVLAKVGKLELGVARWMGGGKRRGLDAPFDGMRPGAKNVA